MALKVLFHEILHDQDFIEEVPPWYSPVMSKAVCKSEKVEAWWDVPVFVDHQGVHARRVDARFVNHVSKKVMIIEMSCPWISNREKKSEEKTIKYGLLRWELKRQFKGCVNLHLRYPDPLHAMNSGGIIPSHRVREVLKECVEEKFEREVRNLEWRGKLLLELRGSLIHIMDVLGGWSKETD